MGSTTITAIVFKLGKKMAKLTKQQELVKEEDYAAFLKKRLESKNYKNNVSSEEYEKTKLKYDKVKFRIKILKGN